MEQLSTVEFLRNRVEVLQYCVARAPDDDTPTGVGLPPEGAVSGFTPDQASTRKSPRFRSDDAGLGGGGPKATPADVVPASRAHLSGVLGSCWCLCLCLCHLCCSHWLTFF